MTHLHTPLCDRLGITLPVMQAPMAGGPTTPELVAAVSRAGALGAFGFAYTQPEAMQRDCEAVRAQTDKPFGVNLLTRPQPKPIPPEAQRAAIEALAPYYAEAGLPAPQPARAPYAPDLEAQLDLVESLRPPVFTFHLGDLPLGRIRRLRSLGIAVGASATCVAEARHVAELGVDFIVAQGAEAGGHRGTYLRDPYEAMTGTLALVRLIVRSVSVPVVASGGIMDGAGIAAALALGAQAASLGTAFIACPESGASRVHKESLLSCSEDDTLVTEKFSGGPARALANRFIREMEAAGAPRLAFPAQNALTGPLRAASAKAGNREFLSMYAGQAAPLSRALPAGELVDRLHAEAIEALERLERLRR